MLIIHLSSFIFLSNGEVAFPQPAHHHLTGMHIALLHHYIAVYLPQQQTLPIPYESTGITQEYQFEEESKNQHTTTQLSQYTVTPCEFFSAVRYLYLLNHTLNIAFLHAAGESVHVYGRVRRYVCDWWW